MRYPTYIIESKADIDRCPVFALEHYLWTCLVRPQTFGQLAYLNGQGLYVRMTCIEADPKREMKRHRDMVCKDSAMEAFFAFPDLDLRQTTPPSNDSLYFNFEVNANGAMYAKYGHGRQNRQFLTGEEVAMTGVTARIEPDRWTVEFLIPDLLLARICGIPGLAAGDTFFCNFYKIAEDPSIEHYGAFQPIPTERPNFHLPQHFARTEILYFES